MRSIKKPLLYFSATLLSLTAALLLVRKHFMPLPSFTLANGAHLAYTPCWFTPPKKFKVRCAYFTAPKQSINQTTQFSLPVVYVQANSKTPSTQPILYISGGPGYSVGIDHKSINHWFEWVEKRNWQRDVVFFDQRATGGALPKLACPGLQEKTLENLRQDLSAEADGVYWFGFIKQCYQTLRKQGAPLELITTSSTVADIKNMMRLLELEQSIQGWNLYSVSYGTRVAMDLLKDKQLKINGVILDSVYPQNKHDLQVVPELMEFALQNLQRECRLSHFCKTKLANFRDALNNVVTTLDKNPAVFNVQQKNVEQKVRVVLNGYRLIWAIYISSYQWATIEQLPDMILRAQSDTNALTPLAEKFAADSLDTALNLPAFYSVECHDRSHTLSEGDYQKELNKYPAVKAFTRAHWKYDICHFWDSQRANAEFFKLSVTQVPILILNGELDPVTPPYWAEEIGKNFARHYTYIIPGMGHGIVDSDECSTDIVKKFLQNPSVRPDARCRRDWGHPDFKFSEKAPDSGEAKNKTIPTTGKPP